MRLHLALATTLSLFAATLHAAHFLGGTLSSSCMGGGFYQMELVLYMDCSGAAMIPQTLLFTNDCGTSFTQSNLAPNSVEEVSPLCAAQLGNSTCNGGSQIGIKAYTFSPVVFLSPCDSWTISWSICCRGETLNVMTTPGLYVETRVNNAGGVCNDAPRFTDRGIPHVCTGQPVSYDPLVTDPEGNTIRHRFIEARFASPVPVAVNYFVPHFGGEPWTGMVVDSLSGVITFTPTEIGSIIVVVQVDEYDDDGNWLGSVMRDFVFQVLACSNQAPAAASGTLVGATGSGSVTGAYSAAVCTNGEVCLELVFTDPDAGQSLSFSSNVDEVLPGASFNVSGGNPATVTICWDATDAELEPLGFHIIARDDHCPVVGMQSYSYTLTFAEAEDAGAGGTALACPQTPAFALVDSLGGPTPPGGSWTGPNGQPHGDFFNPATDPGGLYTYTVSGAPGCTATALLAVVLLPANDPLCSTIGMDEATRLQLLLYPNPTNGLLLLQGLDAWSGHAVQLEVLDALGRTVAGWQQVVQHGSWPITLPATVAEGSYLLRLNAPGKPPLVQRFQVLR
jgi:hypothetical protein